MIYCDLDDFCEENASLDLLQRLKEQIPAFRVTLFTIVGRCSAGFVREIRKLEWIEMVPHGWRHDSNYECLNWSYTEATTYLNRCAIRGFPRGFKAPGWQISTETYFALRDAGFWVADQAYNNQRRPAGLKTYLLDSANKIHGHIGNWGGQNANELSLILPAILAHRDEEFGFVRDQLI